MAVLYPKIVNACTKFAQNCKYYKRSFSVFLKIWKIISLTDYATEYGDPGSNPGREIFFFVFQLFRKN